MSESIGDSSTPGQVWYYPLPSIKSQGLDSRLHVFTLEQFKFWRVLLSDQRKRVLIVGMGSNADDLRRALRHHTDYPCDIVGYTDGSPVDASGTSDGQEYLGTYEELLSLVEEQRITTVAVCIQNQRGVLPHNALLNLKAKGIEIVEGLLLQEQVQGRISLVHVKPSHLIFSSTRLRTRLFRVCKRALDVIGAFSALVFLSPLFIILISLIMLTSNGSPFTWTHRVGRYGRRFSLGQLHISALYDDHNEPLSLTIFQRFLHSVGKLMTRCNFGRLPELINILCGHMSFVGPQPENVRSAYYRDRTIPFYSLRHSIRPGMTGWTQIQPTRGLTTRTPEDELEYDLYYVRNQSVVLDFRILCRTLRFVLLK